MFLWYWLVSFCCVWINVRHVLMMRYPQMKRRGHARGSGNKSGRSFFLTSKSKVMSYAHTWTKHWHSKCRDATCSHSIWLEATALSGSQKQILWKKWYEQANRSVEGYMKQCSQDMVEAMFKANQAQRDSRWPAILSPNPLGADQSVASETVPEFWWCCRLCYFKVPDKGSFRKRIVLPFEN